MIYLLWVTILHYHCIIILINHFENYKPEKNQIYKGMNQSLMKCNLEDLEIYNSAFFSILYSCQKFPALLAGLKLIFPIKSTGEVSWALNLFIHLEDLKVSLFEQSSKARSHIFIVVNCTDSISSMFQFLFEINWQQKGFVGFIISTFLRF